MIERGLGRKACQAGHLALARFRFGKYFVHEARAPGAHSPEGLKAGWLTYPDFPERTDLSAPDTDTHLPT